MLIKKRSLWSLLKACGLCFCALFILRACFSDGETQVYRAYCSDNSYIAVETSIYQHPSDFELGDTTGYGLFFVSAGGTKRPLYQNGSFSGPASGGYPSWYVGWRYDGRTYSGPGETNDFAPLPESENNADVRAFERPTRTYNRDARPPDLDNPPYMNIFLDPATVSRADFEVMADCLGRNRAAINRALTKVSSYFPWNDKQFYHPLRLGGIVLGLPPYSNASYIGLIKALWGNGRNDRVLPDYGRFTLYPGESVNGVVAGRMVQVALTFTGLPVLHVDGVEINPVSTKATNDSGVKPNGLGGWIIGDGVCTDDLTHCQKMITPVTVNNDRSLIFNIWIQTHPHIFEDIRWVRK